VPDPADYETKQEFMEACVSTAVDEGKKPKQAVAMCSAMWEERSMSAQLNANDPAGSKREGRDTLTRIQRVSSVDEDNGTFGMTLVTDGEASDGHILAIEGGVMPERMPMQLSHWNEPTKTVGSITRMRKHLTTQPRKLTAVGMMELDGEGAPAELRRDLMHMIAKGHIGAVSVSWDFDWKDVTPRSKLPADHPHYVDPEKEQNPRKRYGLYFKRWKPLEGSIVAVGADPKALIGRARETSGVISTYWGEMATEAEKAIQDGIKLPEDAERAVEVPAERVYPDLPGLVAVFGAHVRELSTEVNHLVKLGVPFDELAAVYEKNKPAATMDETVVRLQQRLTDLESRLEARLRVAEHGRVRGEPPASGSAATMLRQAIAELKEEQKVQREEFIKRLRAMKGELPSSS